MPPESVQESVYEEAEYAGKSGPNASDPPKAARKQSRSEDDVSPGADLDPDEAADVMETQEEAHRTKETRVDQRDDDDLISLDTPD